MKAYNTLNIETSQLIPIICGVDRNEIGHFGPMFDNNLYRVMASARPW